MIKIFVCDTSPLRNERTYSEIIKKITPSRVSLADGIHRPAAKRLSVGAAYLLALALKERGIDATAVSLGIGEHGKPYINEYPDIYFSLAHSDSYAVCAVSDEPVGCDIELRERVDIRVAERFFSTDERELVSSAQNPEETFLRLWTLKESYVKLTGKGIAHSRFSSFTVGLEPCVNVSTAPDIHFAEYDVDRYHIAVCSRTVDTPELCRININDPPNFN